MMNLNHFCISLRCLVMSCMWTGLDGVIYLCDKTFIVTRVLEIIWKALTSTRLKFFICSLFYHIQHVGRLWHLLCSSDKARRVFSLFRLCPVGQCLCDLEGLKDVLCCLLSFLPPPFFFPP